MKLLATERGKTQSQFEGDKKKGNKTHHTIPLRIQARSEVCSGLPVLLQPPVQSYHAHDAQVTCKNTRVRR